MINKISVLVLTLNEAVNLPGCLQSVGWCDDIVVFDSFSSDETLNIAQQHGARVLQRHFDNYANQRNAALQTSKFKHSWVYMMDADEQITPNLHQEMVAAIEAAGPEITVFRLRRKDMFMGRWLRRSSGYPTWASRLLRPDRVWIERDINEELHTDGQVGYLQEHFIHYPFNRGMEHWLARHNQYSSMEARRLLAEQKEKLMFRGILSRDPTIRRKTLKQLAYRFPMRPWLVFFYLYGFKMGFLDGVPGWHYARLRSIYEYFINLKIREYRQNEMHANDR